MSQAKLLGEDHSENSVFPAQFKSEAEYDAWFRKEVEEGMRDAEEGHLVSHEEVMKKIDAILKN